MSHGVFFIPFDLDPAPGAGSRAETPFALSEFIAGDENRWLKLVADDLRESKLGHNPVVVYGPTGLGKTHLLRGLVNSWKHQHPRTRVVLVTAADFAREYVRAIQADAVDDFRAKYRRLQLLAIDDVQHLADKTEAQGELVRTLDRLLERETPVLMTCSLLPNDLEGLSRALVSRLMGGLAAPVERPCRPTRMAMVKRLAKVHGITLSEPVVEALVCDSPNAAVFGTVPEINRALLELQSTVAKAKQTITVDFVRRYRRAQAPEDAPPTLRAIQSAVAKFFQVPSADLKGATRRQQVVYARSVAMYLARELTEHSLDEVGEHFGNRDHTTVLHACRKTAELTKSDPPTQQAVEELVRQLKSGLK